MYSSFEFEGMYWLLCTLIFPRKVSKTGGKQIYRSTTDSDAVCENFTPRSLVLCQQKQKTKVEENTTEDDNQIAMCIRYRSMK